MESKGQGRGGFITGGTMKCRQISFIVFLLSLEIDTLGGTAAPLVSADDAATSHSSRLDCVLIITKSAHVLSLLA